jgi:hypothetical protein
MNIYNNLEYGKHITGISQQKELLLSNTNNGVISNTEGNQNSSVKFIGSHSGLSNNGILDSGGPSTLATILTDHYVDGLGGNFADSKSRMRISINAGGVDPGVLKTLFTIVPTEIWLGEIGSATKINIGDTDSEIILAGSNFPTIGNVGQQLTITSISPTVYAWTNVGSSKTIEALEFLNPVEDWAVNSFAPVIPDPNNLSIQVRSFSNSENRGIGFNLRLPDVSITTIHIEIEYRIADGSDTGNLVLGLFTRLLTSTTPSPIGTWSSVVSSKFDFPITGVTADTNYKYYTLEKTIGDYNTSIPTPGSTSQFEIVRLTSDTGDVNSEFLYISRIHIRYS